MAMDFRTRLRRFRDWRLGLLVVALILLAAVLIRPYGRREHPGYPLVAVIDITRSMNVRDMRSQGEQMDRLGFVKARLAALLRQLPCGSRLGVGVFTERRSTLLILPLEVCDHFHALREVIEHIDWRMAWDADSRIAGGLLDAMKLMQRDELRRHALLFFTDGHEAPPLNPRYRPDLSVLKGKVAGMVIGVGGRTPVPIPKFDEAGRPQGFYRPEDVPHRSTFGEPARPPTDVSGYHPRNAPFGGEWVLGQEHLSSLRASYLRSLAREAGLRYRTLDESVDLVAEVARLGVQETSVQLWDRRPWLGLGAWMVLVLLYGYARFVDHRGVEGRTTKSE